MVSIVVIVRHAGHQTHAQRRFLQCRSAIAPHWMH
jgi:hypothetical protein